MTASFTIARFHRGFVFGLTLLLCATLPVVASEETYRIGVNDVITVRVLYHPDFSVEDAIVRPDGCVNVPVAGDVVVARSSVEEVAAEITEALRQELRDPQVSVRLVRRHVDPVYVLGAVRAPGAVDAHEPVTVAEAIALAQGLSESAAPRWATLIDVEGRERRIDVLEALQGRGEGGAAVISPGETLLVSAQFLVTVVGEVGTPGRYPAEQGDRVADAFAAAGGLTEDAALTGRLIRADGESVELDLDALSRTGDAAVNVALAASDTIVIPRANRRVALVGAFVEPG
ncbi:MAG: polysaccharide biosynthesis/export family protein, partial [Armatimonadota bacterium]